MSAERKTQSAEFSDAAFMKVGSRSPSGYVVVLDDQGLFVEFRRLPPTRPLGDRSATSFSLPGKSAFPVTAPAQRALSISKLVNATSPIVTVFSSTM